MRNQMNQETTALPPILLSHDDYHRLADLARATLARYPADDAQLLLEELHRADTVPASWLPSGVVMMDSHVEFRDDQTGEIRRVQLVYPYHADIKKGRISVLSLVGAALVGLAENQSINWRTRNGDKRRLTVLRASTEPLAEDPDAVGTAEVTASPQDGVRTEPWGDPTADQPGGQI